MVPSILIFVGLVAINLPHLHTSEAPSEYLLGVLYSFMALILWTWYAVANSEFLKTNPQVSSSDWSTLVGICSLFWVIVCGAAILIFDGDQINVDKYMTFDTHLKHYLMGCCILGFLCSWVGAYLWNKASSILPVSMAGQLMVFETIFGVSFVYILQQDLPPRMEWVGMAILIGAVIYGIRNIGKSHDAELTSTEG
jgi:drug/metabolite transporter (DMT)-like permease